MLRRCDQGCAFEGEDSTRFGTFFASLLRYWTMNGIPDPTTSQLLTHFGYFVKPVPLPNRRWTALLLLEGGVLRLVAALPYSLKRGGESGVPPDAHGRCRPLICDEHTTYCSGGNLVKCNSVAEFSLGVRVLELLRRSLLRVSTDSGKRSTGELTAICEQAANHFHTPNTEHSVPVIWDLLLASPRAPLAHRMCQRVIFRNMCSGRAALQTGSLFRR